MRPELLDELRAADPERDDARPPDPDWDAIAREILAVPRRRRRLVRRPVALIGSAAAAVALAVVAAAALLPDGVQPSVIERAYAAASERAIYHYVAVVQELEGPQRRPLAETRSRNEGWIDPGRGQIHEIGTGMEWATDGRRRRVYVPALDQLSSYDEPAPSGGSGPEGGHVLAALTRAVRVGELRDEGPATYAGRPVHRLVAVDAQGTFRQTFLVDADTYLPVLFRTQTGDGARDGGAPGPRERVVEERFERFERLPDDADRGLLEMRPHPGARPGLEPARPPAG